MEIISDFWNWYSSLFYSSNNLVILGVWSATIATASFLIVYIFKSLYQKVSEQFLGLEVKATMNQRLLDSPIENRMLSPVIVCQVVNKNNKIVYINSPTIVPSRKIHGEKEFSEAIRSGEYPKRLEPGERVEEDFETLSL